MTCRGYASVAGKMFGADLMALLGDIGLNSIPTTLDKNEAKKMIDNTLAQMRKWDGMWIFAPGNRPDCYFWWPSFVIMGLPSASSSGVRPPP